MQAEVHLLNRLNSHRVAAHVAPLRWDAALATVARTHSCAMFLHRHMSHTAADDATPEQRLAAAGIPFTTVGENAGMAAGGTVIATVDLLDVGMMAEPVVEGDHRWNIVYRGYNRVGVGIIYAEGQTWVTEDLAG